jgi:formamidopyrimidine-DNA glycosylase
MPEVPDLIYIARHLGPELVGRSVTAVSVKQPVVIRMLCAGSFEESLLGRVFKPVRRHGSFLVFDLDQGSLIAHMMLAGRFKIGSGKMPHQCFSIRLDDGRSLFYGDNKLMGRIYLTSGSTDQIPGFDDQGVDITAAEFTLDRFRELISGKRNQVRVFLMDHTALSDIGNAYADEILFAAGIHPKTRCSDLEVGEVEGLYLAIREVTEWGIQCVEEAGRPVQIKVRDHMRVRGRKGQPCPVCGATIRRTGVLGYDSFFCPRCQRDRGADFIPWGSRPESGT